MCLAGKVHGLKRFAHINTVGCIKISKKHDKHSNIPLKQVCV
jgi:SPX domain protein involved in polyphosphate accumulation